MSTKRERATEREMGIERALCLRRKSGGFQQFNSH